MNQPIHPQHPDPAAYSAYQPLYVRAAPTSGLAVTSFVLGLLWLFWVGSILAVAFGHAALAECRRDGKGGAGLAVAGLVFGYIGVAILLIGLLGAAS